MTDDRWLLRAIEDSAAHRARSRALWEREGRKRAEDYQKRRIAIWDQVLRFCRPAEPADYVAWLRGHVGSHAASIRYIDSDLISKPTVMSGGFGPGVEPLHEVTEEREMADNYSLYVLLRQPKVFPPACGAGSYSLIIPADIQVPQETEMGHNTFYLMRDFTTMGVCSSVPVYRDVAALLRNGLGA